MTDDRGWREGAKTILIILGIQFALAAAVAVGVRLLGP